MKIISFGYTAAPLLAGRKTITRREWKDEYALKFHPGEIVQAYDKQPRFGGKKIGEIRISWIIKQSPLLMPDSDYEEEGFAWLDENPEFIPKKFILKDGTRDMQKYFRMWKMFGEPCWAIKFEPLNLLPFDSIFTSRNSLLKEITV
ncbi:hypothetical protein [Leptospira mayottensis]|uniref:ASCH domain-containing protein n=2 Tax=Leptospira mayottensis TaxID=1137606 RepID=A0AA87MMW6_9LEPT|nr:hypothetical protein [Leptospira mayottensis]AXR64547.1 hypothetical protein DQM28_10250 [Leptospira mayottensis]EKR98587.1 hypothetical protein LEP1GSC125_1881 [Leptospira mayottensis 200901122]